MRSKLNLERFDEHRKVLYLPGRSFSTQGLRLLHTSASHIPELSTLQLNSGIFKFSIAARFAYFCPPLSALSCAVFLFAQMQFLTSCSLRRCGLFSEWSSAGPTSGAALIPASTMSLQTQTGTRNFRRCSRMTLYTSRHSHILSWPCHRSPFSLKY